MQYRMNIKRRLSARIATGAVLMDSLASWMLPSTAFAQNAPIAYPTKPIRLVVPFPAGGATDIFARTLSQKLAEKIGSPVVVENKPGAGGTLGSDLVAKSPSDGYTLLLATSSTHSIGPNLNPKMPYDAVRDFTPIAQVGNAPSIMLVPNSSPAKTIQEWIDFAKKNPGRLNYASSGNGTIVQLTAELFKAQAGLFVVHIPYKGGAPQIAALLGGEIQSSMDVYATSFMHVRSGKFKVLGVASAKRFSLTPDVPTLGEQGFPVEGGTVFALLGPAKLPPEIVATLNRAINTVLDMPDVRERLAAIGVEQVGGSSEVLASTIRNELQKWARLVQSRNLKFD